MSLIPHPTEAGLWENPEWTPGTPGVFALVIGVSQYQWLREDQNSLHLGSLHVSALTAFRFFEWLIRSYRLEGIPVARCRMLLAPTGEERDFAPELSHHLRLADYENCSDAILNWFAEMQALDDSAAAESRSLFFFSGHGLEVTEELQVLLPADYLRPPVPQYNRAIGTDNLRRGLKALKVNRHFLFMDACRSDHDNLHQVEPISGSPILNSVLGRARNSRCLVPMFFSSAAGRESFQPRTPHEGLSLFGSALLEGLRGQGVKADCGELRCVIHFDPLLSYCKQRIPALAKSRFNQEVEQEVRLSGDYVQDPLTEVPPPQAKATVLGLEAHHPAIEGTRRLSITPVVPENWRPLDFGKAHDVFQSEQVTEPIVNARIFSYANKAWIEPGNDFLIHQVRLSDSRRFYEVEFSLQRALAADSLYWFQIEDQVRTFGVVVPTSQQAIRFFFNLETSNGFDYWDPSYFSRVSLSLSATSGRPFGTLARAWAAYRDANLSSSQTILLAPEARLDLETALYFKSESTIGAAIAGLLLVRAASWNHLHDWLRNVADRFPWLADGCVLWAEQLLREFPASDGHRGEARRYLLDLENRNLPLLSEVLAMGYSRLQEFAEDPDSVRDPGEMLRLQRLIARYREAFVHARPGGLFTVWAASRGALSPTIVLHRNE